MFDIGFTELLVVGIVALIVIGPRDLPGMFRTLGKFTAKARSMARDFSRAMEAAADDSGAGDVIKDVRKATSAKNLGLDAVKDVAADMAKWTPEAAGSEKTIGPEEAKLTQERAEKARKIREASARMAQERLDREAEKEAEGWEEDASANADTPSEKPAVKKSVAKKPATKKSPTKKTDAKKSPAKTAVTKAAAKKPASAKKSTAKKTTKTAAKKPAAKKTSET